MSDKQIILSPSKLHAPKVVTVEQGLSIRQIIQRQGDISPCIVEINGCPLTDDKWNYIPSPNDHVLISVPLMGGDGKKNPLRAILTIIVVVVAYVYGGPLGAGVAKGLGGSAAVGSAVGMAVVSTAGMLLVDAIAPIRYSTDSKQSSKDSPTYSINGGQNVANPWGPVPVNLGINRVYPPLGSGSYTEIVDEVVTKYHYVDPSQYNNAVAGAYVYGSPTYQEIVGSDEYLRMLVIWGHGPLKIDDLKIGETLLSSYSDVEVQTREGWSDDEPITLFPSAVHQESIGLILTSADGMVVRAAEPECDELSVDIALPNGLVKVNDDGSKTFRTVAVLIQYREVGAGSWTTHETKTFIDKTTKTIRYGTRWKVDKTKAYEVGVTRLTADSVDDYIVDEVYWMNLRSVVCDNPINTPFPVAATALRIKATDQLNSVINTLNGIVSSYVDTWDGEAWTTGDENKIVSNNPAALYRHVLMGSANAKARTASQLNDAELGEWYEFCETNGYAFNMYCDTKSSVWDTCSDIAAAGRASPVIKGGLWSVTVDTGTQTLVQHITPRNSWGFNSTKILFNPPHAFRIKFVNENNGYQWDERIVYDDGYNAGNATLFESIEIAGITDPDLIWKFGRFHIAQARLRPEIYTLNMDFEHLVASRGDKVRVSHDVPLWGIASGRIKALTVNEAETHITHITLDESITMEAGKTYVCRFRLADGSTLLQSIVLDVGETNIIELTTPLLIASGPEVGDLAMFGETDTETVELLIKSIRRSNDYVAELTLVDFASAIYTADTGTIPAFNPNMTTPIDVTKIEPDPPTIDSVATGIDVATTSGGGSISTIQVYLSAPQDHIKIRGYRVRYRLEGETQWQYTAEQNTLTIPVTNVSDQLTYEIQAQSISVYGIESQWTTVTTGSSDLPQIVPPSATNISAAMVDGGTAYSMSSVLVTFTPPNPPGVYAYSEIYACSDNATYQYMGRDSTGSFTFSGLGSIYKPGDTCYIKVRSVSNFGVRENLPVSASATVVITATVKLASFYAGIYDFWGGNEAIGNAATKIVLGNLDGVPKLALGPSADTLTIDNIATYPGFFADGNGYFRGGTNNKYFRWDGEIEIQAGGLFLSSETQTLSLGDGIYLDGLNETIVIGNVAADGIMFDPVNGQRMYDGGTLKGQWNLDSAWWLGPNSTNKKVEWNPSDDTFYIRGNAAFDTLLFQEVMTTKGTIQIVKSGGELFDACTVTGTTFTIKITKSPSGGAPFANGDRCLIDNGINATWFSVGAGSDQTTYWQYTATYQSGSNSAVYKTGTAIADYGVSGGGGLLLSADMSNAPWLSIFKHSGSPWSDIEYLVKLGNLNGYAGYTSDVYGLAAYIDANNYIKIDPVSGIDMSGKITLKSGSGVDWGYVSGTGKPSDYADVTPPLPSDENQIAYWSFNDGSGLTAVDNSGHSLPGTITGATWVDGKAGKALDFVPANMSGVNCGHNAALNVYNSPFTISMWVYDRAVSTSYPLAVGTYGGNYLGFMIGVCAAGGGFQIGEGPSSVKFIAECSPDLNEWTHLVGTFDGTHMRGYKNGVQVGATVAVTPASWAGQDFVIGRYNWTGYYGNGLIDEVRFYSEALSESEIKALYLNPSGNKSQTVNMDSITNGTYGKVLSTDISAGHITLASVVEDATYKKYTATEQTKMSGMSPGATTDLTLIAQGNSYVVGNSVYKGSVPIAWDASAYSNEGYIGGAYCSVICHALSGATMFGLNSDPATDSNFTSIDYCIQIQYDNNIEVYNNGTYVGSYGTWAVGDYLSVIYDGVNVFYLKNGTVIYSQAVAANLKLHFDCSIYMAGYFISGIKFGPYGTTHDLDYIPNGSTYQKVLATIIDSGYITLLRTSATANNRITITATGVEQYTNNVKMIELASGSLYLGDQSNEHIKASSTGIELKDGATVKALFGSTVIVGEVAANKGNFYVDSSGNSYWRVNTTNLISITNAGIGTINLLAGSDITLTGHDTNYAKILFKGSSYSTSMYSNTTGTSTYIIPSNTGLTSLFIGTVSSRFNDLDLFGEATTVYGYYDAGDSAYVSCVGIDGGTSRISFKTTGGGTSHLIWFTGGVMYPVSNKVIDLGRSGNAFDDMYADDFNNVADIPFLDDRDDLSYIMQMEGSGEYDERTGLEIINDDKLPDFVKTVSKDGKKEVLYNPDGKPYFSVKAMFGWHNGAIRQLNNKIIELESKLKN
jgi:hypothetical protein